MQQPIEPFKINGMLGSFGTWPFRTRRPTRHRRKDASPVTPKCATPDAFLRHLPPSLLHAPAALTFEPQS
jgi:hypothetical protein